MMLDTWPNSTFARCPRNQPVGRFAACWSAFRSDTLLILGATIRAGALFGATFKWLTMQEVRMVPRRMLVAL